jgi:type II secretory ATPase GspE/PulE/Tfp pilus assembly ATPase PilB-like protein
MNAVEFVEYIIKHAHAIGASDIHIEPMRNSYRIRMRVDGVLHSLKDIANDDAAAVAARIKVLAHLDIAQQRLPLDGKFRYEINGQECDIRVSTFPSVHGQTLVLRLLVGVSDTISFDQLGLDIVLQEKLYRLLQKEQGFLVVTGPTGSGKTTTLYAILTELNNNTRNIVTLEDPVEYSLEGVTQGHINDVTGFTFARGIRSLLRQDPDIIMIGEIRDAESANIALEASMTGHLVLSTLHTNDACSTVVRLLDMGIESYLMNAALTGVLAQRLLRKLCSECKRPVRLDLAALGFGIEDNLPREILVYEPVGCPSCNFFGYKGRVGVFEYVEVTEELKRIITHQPSYELLVEQAREAGATSLAQDAFEKLVAGHISMAEFIKVA